MINIFKTEQSVIRTIDAFEDGAWVQMVDPSVQELNKVSEALKDRQKSYILLPY